VFIVSIHPAHDLGAELALRTGADQHAAMPQRDAGVVFVPEDLFVRGDSRFYNRQYCPRGHDGAALVGNDEQRRDNRPRYAPSAPTMTGVFRDCISKPAAA